MIKTKDILTIIESLSKTIATLIQPSSNKSNVAARLPSTQGGTEQTCHFCGDQNHSIRSCPHVEADIAIGKCKRNTEGKVILPNGLFIPRSIPGITIRDCLYEWICRNTPAAPGLLYGIDEQPGVQTFTLNTEGRIEALEKELLQLRKRREVFDGVKILQRKKPTMTPPQTTEVSDTTPISRSTNNPVPDTVKSAAPTAVPVPATPAKPSTSTSAPSTIPTAIVPLLSVPSTQPTIISTPSAPPVHPFANAQDATYAPSNLRNFATPPKPSNDKGKDPAYKTIVPIHQPKIANDIFACSMRSPLIMLTPEELLSISPDVRNRYREAVTPKRVSAEPVNSAHIVEITDKDEAKEVHQLSCSGAALQPGATIVPDPYETYLKHVPHGEHPANLTVACDSNAIRSIYALVDNKEQIECIVDPGSQIVAMSEEVCLGLKLLFDPTIQLNMQSANGEVDRSLGLVRNVPFQIDEVVLYLQAHIIQNAAYDILLGRPFDVLTQSIVKNFANEEQTITIKLSACGFSRFKDLIPHHQGEAALVIDYDGAKPSISFVAPINSSISGAVQSLYLSACSSVSSHLQSLYTADTKASSTATSNTSTWASTLLFSAPFASLPNLSSSNSLNRASTSQLLNSIHLTSSTSTHKTYTATKKKYKPVVLKTRPILGAVPEQFRIIRNIKGDPLSIMPVLSADPQPFEPTGRYIRERFEIMEKLHDGTFLLPDER
ncbi:hypothetical protein AcV7_004191 [Taiwanofungus camphoratus]|nr:hypothetical protein AcV7_004191 [Antrodia cinnamomea]